MTKLPTISSNPLQQRLEVLKTQFPEIFADGKLSLPKLQELLGESVDTSRERFGLTWAGRADAVRALQNGTTATLRPDREQSLEFETTENLILEGDNLEVLKILQHAYHNQVKLIYIDPPYNTGSDLTYEDDFADSAKAYKKYSRQVDGSGNSVAANVEVAGRFHSRWLSSIYPRLQIARNLLEDTGVILISIDDNEQAHLKMILDEIYGNENFIAQLVWEKTRKNDAKLFSVGHEYMFIYAKNLSTIRSEGQVWREVRPGAKEILEEYNRLREIYGNKYKLIEKDLQSWYAGLPNSHPSKKLSRYKHVDKYGPWRDRDISWPGGDGPRYDVIHPKTGLACAVPERGWIFSKPEVMQDQIDKGLVVFRDDHTKSPIRKAHLIPIPEELNEEEDFDFDDIDEMDVGLQVMPSVIYKQSQVAVKYLRNLLNGKIFDNPKDFEVLQRIFAYVTQNKKDALFLDFYGGSGSTAEAVMRMNLSDGGSRRFIIVQLPEPTKQKSASRKAGYENIAQITRFRVRRVAESIADNSIDLGFRAFRWDTSNFKQYDPHAEDQMEMLRALQQNVLEGRSTEDQLFEILLRAGLPLSSRYEVVRIGEQDVYSVQGGKLLICLARPIHEGTLRAMLTHSPKPEQVVCLDVAFESENPDAVKMNIVSEMRDHGIQFRTV